MRFQPPVTRGILVTCAPTMRSGHTRTEVICLLCAISLLALIARPAIGTSRSESSRAVCINNLSRIGQGFASWVSEHGERYPWQVPGSAQSFGSDGTMRFALTDHFRAISNEVLTPRILACPSDSSRTAALTFDVTGRSPLLVSAGQISYLLGHPSVQFGRTLLSGDRNIVNPAAAASCHQFISASVVSSGESNASWGGDVHSRSGQLLYNDGSVAITVDQDLRATLVKPGTDASITHFALP